MKQTPPRDGRSPYRRTAGWSRCLLPASPAADSCRPTGSGCPNPPLLSGHGHRSLKFAPDQSAVLHETFRFHLLFPCAAAHSHIFAGLAFIVTHSASFFHLKTSKDVPQTRDVFFAVCSKVRPVCGCGPRGSDGTHGGSGRTARGTGGRNSWCSRSDVGDDLLDVPVAAAQQAGGGLHPVLLEQFLVSTACLRPDALADVGRETP